MAAGDSAARGNRKKMAPGRAAGRAGAATAVARAGPCSHHRREAHGTGASGRCAGTRAPPAAPSRAAHTKEPRPAVCMMRSLHD